MVVPTDLGVTKEVRGILRDFPKLVANQKGRNRADAFVIAVARLQGGVVLTRDGGDRNANRPKIPFICAARGIPCYGFVDLIRLAGWTF